MITIFVYVKNLTETYECGADSVDSAIALSQQRHPEIVIAAVYNQTAGGVTYWCDIPRADDSLSGEYWRDVVSEEIEHYLS
jgi:hypothetical protein